MKARTGRRKNAGLVETAENYLGLGPNKKRDNLTLEDAENLSREFHGREPRTRIEIAERISYYDKLAILGELEELNILQVDDKNLLPIRFKPDGLIGESIGDSDECVWLCAANEHQIEFADGDQELEFDTQVCRKLGIEEDELDKQYIKVGPVYSIVYFADKHHLEGPKYQEKGTSYEHHFAEEGGKLPELFYDTLNDRILLVGGSYTITPEGIKN